MSAANLAMRRIVLLSLCLFLFARLVAQTPWKHGRLKTKANSHYLQYEDGKPFFWLGDTGWELFHRLTLEEIKRYMDNRAAKGFNVIKAVVLPEQGMDSPNPYGELPLQNLDPLKPNEKYFSVIDSTLRLALQRNIFIGLLPSWGDKVAPLWGKGPEIFDSVNAYTYGKWIGNRYKDFPNIIWILGGDRPAEFDSIDYRPVWRAMANGIINATSHQCIITYHPAAGPPHATSRWLHQEPWLAINMFQSGHGSGHDVACWEQVRKDRNLTPVKPTLDGEPNYEDHPVSPWPKWNPDSGYFRAYDVRKQIYRSVFAGACGVTYGHHAVWQFMSAREEVINYADRGWLNALDRPGAYQAGYLRKLIESRPMQRNPDSSIIAEGQGIKSERMESFRGDDNSYAMIYLPVGKTISIKMQFMTSNNVIAWWFNPKDASVHKIGVLRRSPLMLFTPPTTGIGNDWVLVIDDATKQFKEPGHDGDAIELKK